MRNGSEPARASVTAEAASATPRRLRHGRLFRKYLLLILTLVSGALLVSGGISIYFSYQEQKSALGDLQHEKAVAAASRIEQYIRQIEQQLAYAALPQLDASDVELRRIEFLKLLRQVPEVTDIAQLDAQGLEQVAVSRLGMDVIGSGKDRSKEPAFLLAKRGKPYIGPVYFRKETEPYMTIAVRSGGDTGPVTIADVNLKFIWDVVSRIKIGDKGKAYVVDRTGFLVADPDIGLVLRKTNLSDLAHVKASMDKQDSAEPAMVSQDLAGKQILVSFAPIESLDWKVFVEQPVDEVYARLYSSIGRTALLLLAGLVISAFCALALARGMVRPIRTLADGAQRIGEGDLSQTIVVRTGDELEGLADRFNRMSTQLRESYAGLERKVEERTHELQNSLEQQTAISEILRVISGSPTDVQPVLDAVAERALKLCDAAQSVIALVEGGNIRFVSGHGSTGNAVGEVVPLDRGLVIGRAIIDRGIIHISDLAAESENDFPLGREMQRRFGHHSTLAVPLLREGEAIGAIALWRMETRPFTDKQIALVRTFADQAALAIDNVRLFNQTKEALEQQTATSEVLKTISRTTFELQPVLETLIENATRLCKSDKGSIYLRRGDVYELVAAHGAEPSQIEFMRHHPVAPGPGTVVGLVAQTGQVVHLEDAQTDPAYTWTEAQNLFGFRSIFGVPMLREGEPVGVVVMWRKEVRPFSARERELVATFADQGVIAIQNVRLLSETKEALDQQRASGEVLAAISSSIADATPVFEKIVRSCEQLFAGKVAVIDLVGEDGLVHLGAYHGPNLDEVSALYPHTADPSTATGTAIATRNVVHYTGLDEVPAIGRAAFKVFGIKAAIGAPMMWEGKGIGAIWVARDHAGPFSEKEISLLKTFADQAVIAIQNARLVNETREALDQQRASGEILSAISSSIADTGPVFDKILESCERLFAGHIGQINMVDDAGMIHMAAYHGPHRETAAKVFPFPLGDTSASGLAILRRTVLHYADVERDEDVPPIAREGWTAQGVRAAIVAPMLWEGKGVGAILVGRETTGRFSDKEIALLRIFADQAVIAIQNARLVGEIQQKSQELEIANKHKSAFLASMSHELRTPLNAIIGFSEVLLARLFGELNEKQDDYLKDIHTSGKHLLNLINDVLDLSKVEAGRMDLEPSQFDLPAALADAMTLIRERAMKHGIGLELTTAPELGTVTADERKFKQILLNLLSNAVKFTPDGGRVGVKATRVDGAVQVAVSDTGIGIAPQDQEAVFEEFRQVGTDYTSKAEGTGLGLALTRRFVELHGGRIWLESTLGKGSTFYFTIPDRPNAG